MDALGSSLASAPHLSGCRHLASAPGACARPAIVSRERCASAAPAVIRRSGGSSVTEKSAKISVPPSRPLLPSRFTGQLFQRLFRRRSEEHTSELQSPCNLV